MLERFNSFINSNQIFNPESDELLIAVSGGLDSVVLLHLLAELKCKAIIAHCNFSLRGAESDADEKFVKQLGEKYNFTVYVRRFQTKEYGEQKGISTQMAARELRYNWFHKLAKDKGLNYIALAHHLDDRIETFFVNLLRGTGVKGLDSLWVKRDILIRPLLFATKMELETFASDKKLMYREDSSNKSNKYIRNSIRHNVIPNLLSIQPSYNKTMAENLDNFRFASDIYCSYFNDLRAKLICKGWRYDIIEIKELKYFSPLEKYLFEVLQWYSFSSKVCSEISESILGETKSGSIFESDTHQLLFNRDKLLIREKASESIEKSVKSINEGANILKISKKQSLNIKTIKTKEGFKLTKNANIAFLNKSKLKFPLIIRKWEQGDFFYPIGMRGKKKLSDFFIDSKISVFDKDDTYVLLSGKDVVWVIGYRLDERFKFEDSTEEVLIISLITE